VADQRDLGRDRAVELVLGALQLDVADQDPGEAAAEEQADADDADRRRDETVAEAQLLAAAESSRR
jgi:hypothetical protein